MSLGTRVWGEGSSFSLRAESFSKVIIKDLEEESYLEMNISRRVKLKGRDFGFWNTTVKVYGRDIHIHLTGLGTNVGLVRQSNESERCSYAMIAILYKVCDYVTIKPKLGESLEGVCSLELKPDDVELNTLIQIRKASEYSRELEEALENTPEVRQVDNQTLEHLTIREGILYHGGERTSSCVHQQEM